MALHWNVEKVEDQSIIFAPDGKLRVLTEILIMMSMPAGYCRITEGNCEEIHRRLDELFKLGFYHFYDEERRQRAATLEEVRSHIGLTTNASRFTRSEFNKRVKEYAT